MSLKPDLMNWLLAQAALTALTGTRIYFRFAPTSATKPYITFQRVNSNSVHHMAAGTSVNALRQERYQFDVWGDDDEQVDDVKEALDTLLNGITTTMGSTSVRRVFLETDFDNIESPDDGTEVPEYRSTSSYIFHFLRS